MQCQSCKTNTTATGLFRAIMAKEGLRGLYRGVLPPVYSMAAVNAYLFAVEGAFSRAFGKRDQIDEAIYNVILRSNKGKNSQHIFDPYKIIGKIWPGRMFCIRCYGWCSTGMFRMLFIHL